MIETNKENNVDENKIDVSKFDENKIYENKVDNNITYLTISFYFKMCNL